MRRILSEWSKFDTPQLLIPVQDTDAAINLFGPIASEDRAQFWREWFQTEYHTSDVAFLAALEATTADHVRLVINSPGGDAFAGSAIRAHIQNEIEKGRTFDAHIVGVAASAAAFVAVAAQKVVMSDMAMFMVHKPSLHYDAIGAGNDEELQVVINNLESRKQQLKELNRAQIQVFQKKTGKTEDEVRTLIQKQTWFNAVHALESGFCDEIQPSAVDLDLDKPPAGRADVRSSNGASSPMASLPRGADQQQQGVSSMNSNEMCAILGLAAGTDLSEAQVKEAFKLARAESSEVTESYARIQTENKELKAQLKKVASKSLLSKAKLTLKAHLDRGAITPQQMTGTLTTIMSLPDAEEQERQLEIQDEIFAMLPDGDNPKTPGATARQPIGTGETAEGLDGEDGLRAKAYAFAEKVKEHKDKGSSIAEAQDKAMAELSDQHLDAYLHHDFDADKDGDPLEEE